MNGAESLIRTLAAAGADVCFANPGTSEMHLVQGIDAVADMRAVLCLFEGVCTGAADGFGRMTGRPATTLMHLGAGLGNGIANLHNARRAGTPIVNLVGDHAIHHVAFDAPLTADIAGIARPVSCWVRTARSASGLARDGADAVAAALTPNPASTGQIATLIVPSDCAWGDADGAVAPLSMAVRRPVSAGVIDDVARRLGPDSLLLLDGNALGSTGIRAAGALAARTGCRFMTVTFPARVEVGPHLPFVERLPYFPEQVLETLAHVRLLVLVGADSPVSFFAYRGQPGSLVPAHCEVTRLGHVNEDLAGALEAAARLLGTGGADAPTQAAGRPGQPTGALTTRTASALIGRHLPDDAIIAIDSGGGGAAWPVTQSCAPHTWLNLTGGAIGQGAPVATGAAIACPGRRVFALLGDGGFMYTNQALWTQAREGLDVTTVVYANQRYNILDVEYRRIGVNAVGTKAASLFDIGRPAIDHVRLAEAMGVPAVRATTCEEFDRALARSVATPGPFLIEAVV